MTENTDKELGQLDTDVLIIGSGPIGAVFARELLDRTGAKILCSVYVTRRRNCRKRIRHIYLSVLRITILILTRILCLAVVDVGDAGTPVPGAHLKNVAYFQKDVNYFANIIKADFHPISIAVNRAPVATLGTDAYTVSAEDYKKNYSTWNENPDQDAYKNLSGAGCTYKVGGMGTHWTAACPRMHQDELGDLENLVTDEDREELYKRAEVLFDVTQEAFNDSIRHRTVMKTLREEYEKDSIPEDKRPQALPLSVKRRALNQSFLKWGSTATVLGPHAKPSCIHLGAEPSMNVNTARPFRILEQHLCRKLVMKDEDDDKKSVEYAVIHNMLRNERIRVKAKHYIVCCGTVLSAQLLHASGLGNGKESDFLPALGRYLTEQPLAFCQVVMKRSIVEGIGTKYPDEVAKDKKLRTQHDPIPIPHGDGDPQCWFPYSKDRPWHCQIHRDAFAYGELAPNVDPRLIVDL
ncbi:hypothetical protein BSKO_09660 [Bryopsis sp. KO-2023]|nr:hypothetical protein BSKO_09660 [Bryopsis sp. KO-2023]